MHTSCEGAKRSFFSRQGSTFAAFVIAGGCLPRDCCLFCGLVVGLQGSKEEVLLGDLLDGAITTRELQIY